MPGTIMITIDHEINAAYVRLSTNDVARTLEVSDSVLIDLDEFDLVVGIEVLRLDADLPYTRLGTEFHVHSTVVDQLRQIRPSVGGFFAHFQSAPDGTLTSSANMHLTSGV